MRVPTLETERLLVREWSQEDLEDAVRLFDTELADAHTGNAGTQSGEARRRWLLWTVLGYEQYAHLYQPPYGERAVVRKDTGTIIGAVGYVPSLAPFGQMPFGASSGNAAGQSTPEFGLYWAISPAHRNQGYATEAANALIVYAFTHLSLARVVATTEYDNAASLGVMRRLGMRIEGNPLPTPPWLQAVGIRYNEGHEWKFSQEASRLPGA